MISLISFLMGAYLFVKVLIFGATVPGWGSLIVSAYFLGGLIIALLGLVGSYIGKIYDQVKARPLYIIAEQTDKVTAGN
ncbi:MAG: glycosyltransferase, partial [Gammaproteobacteria bacterium]|nr:glycosyltransferase [Gammaproteobacteria bacterium]